MYLIRRGSGVIAEIENIPRMRATGSMYSPEKAVTSKCIP